LNRLVVDSIRIVIKSYLRLLDSAVSSAVASHTLLLLVSLLLKVQKIIQVLMKQPLVSLNKDLLVLSWCYLELLSNPEFLNDLSSLSDRS
jgi:hypothetical protein